MGAHHRAHYLRAATSMLADWRTASPCPIRFARFYARQKELAQALTALTERVSDDFESHEIAIPDPNYLRPPKTDFEYWLNEHGAVDEVMELKAPSHWPNIPNFLTPDHLVTPPLYNIGDLFCVISTKVAPREPAPVDAALSPAPSPNPTSDPRMFCPIAGACATRAATIIEHPR